MVGTSVGAHGPAWAVGDAGPILGGRLRRLGLGKDQPRPPRIAVRRWIEKQIGLLDGPFNDYWSTIAAPNGEDTENPELKRTFIERLNVDRQNPNFIARRLEQCLKEGFDERMFDPDYFLDWFHGRIRDFIKQAEEVKNNLPTED